MARLPPPYVINLDRSPERLVQFRRFNRDVEDAARFPAVDGLSLDRHALAASGYIDTHLPWGPGTIGCAMSHVMLWELAAEGNGATIFEDDVVLPHRFRTRASEVLAGLPKDWDFILWGCLLNPGFAWVDLGDTRVRLHCYGEARHKDADGLRGFQEQDGPRTAVKLLHAFGHHAYSVSAKGARAALDYLLPMRSRQIVFPDAGVRITAKTKDVDLCGLYPSIKAFLCLPNLALPGPHGSVRELTDAA
jgi:GR25 family glycosyltransferase involved in LPS biosynthesis